MTSSVPELPGLKAPEDLARVMRNEVAELIGPVGRSGRRITGFPGAQPVSFSRHHLTELQKRDYYLCEKTDGIRCLLYFTENEGKELHILIDRKNDYYYVREGGLHFPLANDPSFQSFHTRTLADGELVNDKLPDGSYRLRFLVFDCLIIDGQNLMGRTLDKRLAYFKENVDKPFKKLCRDIPGALDSFEFELSFKDMEKPYATQMMFEQKLPNLPHGNDGLIFTCRLTDYTPGTDENILKWKPPHENTIDFLLVIGNFPHFDPEDGEEDSISDYEAIPELHLHTYHGNDDYRYFADLYVDAEEWESLKARNEVIDKRIMECYRDPTGRWRGKRDESLHRFRDDKDTPNHISVVHKVLESIDEGVTQEDLIRVCADIQRAWKGRHPEEEEMKRRAEEARRRGTHPVR